jgi:hypothetical protein
MLVFSAERRVDLVGRYKRFGGKYRALKMEAVCSSETLLSTYKSTRRYNPKDQHRHLHRRENLKSNTPLKSYIAVTVKIEDARTYRRHVHC